MVPLGLVGAQKTPSANNPQTTNQHHRGQPASMPGPNPGMDAIAFRLSAGQAGRPCSSTDALRQRISHIQARVLGQTK